MLKVLKLDEIKSQIDVPKMIQAIEDGFVLYSEDKVVVPAGTVIWFTFFHNKGDIYHDKITFKNEMVLTPQKELLHALYFNKSIIFRALGYRITCPALEIDGQINLR